MRDGQVSVTAQRVAAVRLGFERVPTPYGDPAADERLAADVAGADPGGVGERMTAYLRHRTAFFDQVVVRGIEQGIRQLVVIAAGYDGRALRYAASGVRWFEVDHPNTQRDKRLRLARLDIDTADIAFVPVDLTAEQIPEPLVATGFEPGMATAFLCEGLAVYLTMADLWSLTGSLRQVAGPGSVLAISLSIDSGEVSETRRQFREAVAAVGEPARSSLTAEQAGDMFAATGWVPDADPRRRLAGLVIARPSARGAATMGP